MHDAGAPARVKQRVQRPAGGQPRAPVDEADEAVAAEGNAEVGWFAIHAQRVARDR